ncbi:MAG TPA: autotransporter domain-containing protein [Gammaproteobacteria bacterium]|nr:autotransporter domain-containing protein [Gammaproteobacteria bacterium]
MLKKRYSLFLIWISSIACFAAPPDNGLQGNLIFLGVNHTSTKSVWLSLTNAAGSFKLEGPGNQLVDEWSENQRGLRLSLSPFVSQGNGGTHHLINSANNKKLDSQNQNSDIVFPPFPPWQPGEPSHPIVIPPGSPGTPSHPIVIPPESPGTPTHPIVIPPESPGTPTHPIVISPGSPEKGYPIPEPTSQVSQESLNNGGENFTQSAPITHARQLDEDKSWNVWSDNYYFGIRDGRNFVNTTGDATNFVIGADRHITTKLVGGLTLSSIHLDTTAFNNGLENNVSGYKIGPYVGYQFSPKWAIDGSVNYGQFQNKNTIVTLNSEYVTKLINATLHSTGLYQFGSFQIRPQPLISYTYFKNPTYDFNGAINNIPTQITRQSEHFALGLAEFKIEGNYTKKTKKGTLIQPYTEIGIDYAFTRPSNDQVYSGNLALASLPKTSGLFTLGLRTLYSKKLLIQASASYLSIGQKNYDLWDARLLFAYSFI